MLTLLEYLDNIKEITAEELKQVERYLDAVFSKLGMDVEFTRHFLDRLNDERNGKQITKKELVDLFTKEYVQYGKTIAKMGPDQEAVLTDLSSDVNTPIALKWNREKRTLEMVAKTVMRKSNFRPNNSKERQYKVK